MENNDSSRLEQTLDKNQRNIANNANNVRVAADVASKTSNPYAKAAGTAIKAADKISGGKASEKLGKTLNNALKTQGLKGKMMQAALNKMSENGTSDRIGKAMNAKNNNPNMATNAAHNARQAANSKLDVNTATRRKTEEESTGGAYDTFNISAKVLKTAMIILTPVFVVIVFCCLLISASQVFLNAISLGTADSLSDAEVEEKINKKGIEGLDEEKTDDDVAYDMYIDDSDSISFRNSKLNNFNVVQVAKKDTYLRRKYNEASLDNIEDFYPAIEDESKNYDKNMVYDFYFKMYNLYKSYESKYGVQLDLPLLMATLNLQSTDKNVIFEANLSDVDRKNTARELPIEEFDFYYDWANSDYRISKNNSEHDMEILAQNMVSHQVEAKCINSDGEVTQEKILKDKEIEYSPLVCAEGETYETEDLGYFIDNEKYKEFLRQFLEKKYYLEGEHAVEELELPTNDSTSNEDSFGDEIINNTTPAIGNFRSWTQCGQSWSSIIVPKSSKTMCSIGCLITSVTMQIARSGTVIATDTIDPGIAVKKYNFANGGNFYWHSTTNIAPNFTYLTNISLLGMNKKSIADKLTSYDSSRYYIILAVSKKDRNKVHHYVALDYVDKSDNKIYIMDPAGVAYTDLYNWYKVYTAHIYEKKD